MPSHLMIVPSLACPAECSYCFGPHQGDGIMALSTIQSIIQWVNLNKKETEEELEITFHGGEPLASGIEFYQKTLPLLAEKLNVARLRFSVQSNLWLLTEDFCKLFTEYNVSIGTSLDGPETINDRQRGEGYFAKTMQGITLARKHQISVGCICTFTKQSAPYYKEIFNFFVKEGFPFSIHPSVPSINNQSKNSGAIEAEEYSKLLVNLLELYLANINKTQISTLDSLIRTVSSQKGEICTFNQCLGNFLAIDPQGDIYPCQRFCGIRDYKLGNVSKQMSLKELKKCTVWNQFKKRQEQIKSECHDCSFVNICYGGCPYNVLAKNNKNFDTNLKDPYCFAYKNIYKLILDKATTEVFSTENIDSIIHSTKSSNTLLHNGKFLSLMNGDPHPHQVEQSAKRLIASVVLAETNSPPLATKKLEELGIISNYDRSFPVLNHFYQKLNSAPEGLNNLYVHITYACNLHCSHCYSRSDSKNQTFMSINRIKDLTLESSKLGFRQVIITGGEPLIHPQNIQLLAALKDLRQTVKPAKIVLRTNLAGNYTSEFIDSLSDSTDQMVVSIDGDQERHDQRRGRGSYKQTVKNLYLLMEKNPRTDVSLATVMPLHLVNENPGKSVKALAQKLGIKRIRFKPLLPIGRGKKCFEKINPEHPASLVDAHTLIANGFMPEISCGISQNLYISPNGAAHPCYALDSQTWALGQMDSQGSLKSIIESKKFQNLKQYTVNSNSTCKNCSYRYLCGGACRSWFYDGKQLDLNAPPFNCERLYNRAELLFQEALSILNLSRKDFDNTKNTQELSCQYKGN